MLGVAEVEQLATKEVAAVDIASASDRALLGRLATLADSQEIRVALQRVYSLEEATDGLDTLQNRHMRGATSSPLARGGLDVSKQCRQAAEHQNVDRKTQGTVHHSHHALATLG